MNRIREISLGIIIGAVMMLPCGHHNNKTNHPSSDDVYINQQDSIKIMKVNEWNILYHEVGNDSIYYDIPKSMFFKRFRNYRRTK